MTTQVMKKTEIEIDASPLVSRILHLTPCEEAKIWLSAYDDPTKAWAECPRGDWMLWYIAQQIASPAWSDERKPLVACALDCALTVRHLWPENLRDKMSAAVETLQAWCRGDASLDAAKAARKTLNIATATAATAAAYAASTYTTATAATAAAYAAAYYAYAADAAAYAAAYYAYDAYAADAADATAASLSKMKARTADIVRRHYPHPPACAAP